MTGKLEGKVAIVTGGGFGFGAGIVKKFTNEGAKVLVLDINEATAQQVAAAAPKGSAVALCGNVSSLDNWKTALKTVLSEFGRLDVVVNNAGVLHKAQPSIEVSEEDFDRMFEINVKSIYQSAKAVVPYFKEQGKGLFINISSISAPRPRPNLVWYAASKSAISTASRGLAVEWAKDNIRVNVIQPVAGETAMVPFFLGQADSPEARKAAISTIPLGRFSRPEDIANAACYLASDDAAFMTGALMDVDGGRGV